jgi:hypothetical protein
MDRLTLKERNKMSDETKETELGQVSLTTIGEGAALELFDHELGRVLENITDINFPWRAAREITLKINVLPNEDRDEASFVISCTSKLAQAKAFPTRVFISKTARGVFAIEAQRPKQTSIFDKSKNDNVLPLNERG